MLGKIITKYRVIKEKDMVALAEKAKHLGMPLGKFLDQIIRAEIGNAMNSQEKILKEQQRIPKIKKNIDTMVSFLNKGENESDSAFNKQLYDNLFEDRINSILAKIKK